MISPLKLDESPQLILDSLVNFRDEAWGNGSASRKTLQGAVHQQFAGQYWTENPGFADASCSKQPATILPSLSDLLATEPSTYFSYACETKFAKEFSSLDHQRTLLVPMNKAVMAQSRKTHQGPASLEPEIAMTEEQYDKQSKHNVERWIVVHTVHFHIWLPDVPAIYDTLLNGKSVAFTPTPDKKNSPDWSKVTFENGVHIVRMKEGEEGVIYMINGTIDLY